MQRTLLFLWKIGEALRYVTGCKGAVLDELT